MKLKFLFITALAFLLMAGSGFAISFGDLNAGANITINDTIWDSNGSRPINQGGEDNETEKLLSGQSTIASQPWDLEGIFWNGTDTATIIAGFNFDVGVQDISIGDLFVGSFGDYVDPSNHQAGRHFVAEYAVDLARDGGGNLLNAGGGGNIYSGVGISTTEVTTVKPASNPYLYSGGGSDIGNHSYTIGGGDTVTGSPFSDWAGGSHYYLQISGLEELAGAINSGSVMHITLECGNDTLRGAVAAPEPATMMLSGLGLLSMAAFLRRRYNKKS